MLICHYYAEKGGWRIGILFHEGRKSIKILDVSELTVERYPAEKLKCIRPLKKAKPKKTARRLRKRRALYKKCSLRFSKKAVENVIEQLEA